MKKTTLFSAAFFAAALIAPTVMEAQTTIPSASTKIYDFSGWENRKMLELFAKAADEGRKFPTQAEFEAEGIYLDLEFVRSHTRYNPIIEQNGTNNLLIGDNDLAVKRRIWMNLPTGQGKGDAGFPTSVFHSDVYSMWNYTHIFGSWNHGFMQAPGSWVAAAHKNGSYIYSGIEFFDYASGNQSAYADFIAAKNDKGEYKYLDAVLNCLIFLGQDGINYNFEQGNPQNKIVQFHAALQKRAKEIGFNEFHIGAYTNSSMLSVGNAYQLLGSNTTVVPGDTEPIGFVHDAFLNYSGGDFNAGSAATSVANAKAAIGSAENVYQGVWIVGMDRNWAGMNYGGAREMNMCLWGEHDVSRFFQFTVGSSQMNAQENYQILQDRTMGGGNRNLLNLPTISNNGNNFQVMLNEVNTQMTKYHGFAAMAPERSAIQGNLPFATNFTLGNGDIYFYKGKKTLGSWYNMGQQDYVPTYRWLRVKNGDLKTNTSDPIDVRFSHEEAWIGGSSIKLSGAAASTDLVIYKTELAVKGSVKATVAVKNMAEVAGASHLSLILQKADGSWVVAPYGDTKGRAWEEKTLNVAGLADGDVIKHIGVRIEGAGEDYKLFLGEIKIDDGHLKATPAPILPESLVAEVREETAKSLSVKLGWTVNDAGYNTPTKERGMVFNDEVNIDHFRVLLKDGESGKVFEVGRTANWSAYVGNIDLEQFKVPYVGVCAVSTDLNTTSAVVWIPIERYANPDDLPVISTDLYAGVYVDPTSNGLQNAIEGRWIEDLTTTGATGNLDYHRYEPVGEWDPKANDGAGGPAEGNTNTILADDVLTVTQGETVKFHIRGHNHSDGIKYCLFKAFIDWDLDRIFNSEENSDEVVWTFGTINHGASPVNDGGTTRDKFQTEGVDFEVKVPADAAVGTSRLRIVACDAWFAGGLNASGGLNKGFALDIPVVVRGDENASRKPTPNYLDWRDQGEADEAISAIENITLDVESNMGFFPAITSDNITFTNVEKAWVYNLAGQMVKFISDAEGTVNVRDLSNGAYVVKMQNGNLVRSSKLIVK